MEVVSASTGDVGEQLSSDLEVVSDTYEDDFDKDLLSTQLSVLGANFNNMLTLCTIKLQSYTYFQYIDTHFLT